MTEKPIDRDPEILVALFGTMKAGCIVVPIDIDLRGAFLRHQPDNAAPAMVAAEAGLPRAFGSIGGPAQPDRGVQPVSQ